MDAGWRSLFFLLVDGFPSGQHNARKEMACRLPRSARRPWGFSAAARPPTLLPPTLLARQRIAPLLSAPRACSSGMAAGANGGSKGGPTREMVREMPRHISELSGEMLFLMTKTQGGSLIASRERLRRDIMWVDDVDYEAAGGRIVEIARYGTGESALLKAPYYAGWVTAQAAGWASIPLVFSLELAMSFNRHYVMAPLPDEGGTDTLLEVGIWTWQWMEPPLGTFSFFLLCAQFGAQQRANLGIKPFTARLRSRKANQLCAAFPQYDRSILRDYAKAICFDDADADGLDNEPLWLERSRAAGGRDNVKTPSM